MNGPRCYIEYLVRVIKKKNKNVKINLFEEGYSSYTKQYEMTLFNFSLFENLFRKISSFYRGNHINKYVSSLYLFEPELLLWNCKYEVVKIKNVDNDNTFLNTMSIFFTNYNHVFNDTKCKFIFLEESFWLDYNENGDLKMLEKISKDFPLSDFYVRLHPRSYINRFEMLNVNMYPDSPIPWELLLLKYHKDTILVTVSSGSAISSRHFFNMNNPIIFLKKCCVNNHMEEESINIWFEKWIKIHNDNVFCPENYEEFLDIIKMLERGKNYE